MQMETLGHAVMLLSQADGTPVLATDPWVIGSCYWRSWWMVNYPTPQDIQRIAASRYLYLTHEHADHLHPPSLRKLADVCDEASHPRPEILLPDFLIMKMEPYLQENGWQVRRLPARQWVTLQDDVRVLSIPLWENDSILLIDTPNTFIININDAKPPKALMEEIGTLRASIGKFSVLLRSHSPAGPANSYFRYGKRLESSMQKRMKAIRNVCRRTGADLFQPFASQVVFCRPDTVWANDYRMGYTYLQEHWQNMGNARLLAPFSKLNLQTQAINHPAPDKYNAADAEQTLQSIDTHLRENAKTEWTVEDTQRLQQMLRMIRWLLLVLLPRGFSIQADDVSVYWRPWHARFYVGKTGGHFTLKIPLLPLKEAVNFGHLGDLAIPMFTEIHLDDTTPQRKGDIFFMLIILRDYGYLRGLGTTLRWLWWAWGIQRSASKPLPYPAQ